MREARVGQGVAVGEAAWQPQQSPCLAPPVPRSELGGVYDSCNLFLGLGRRERKSQVRRDSTSLLHATAQLHLALSGQGRVASLAARATLYP